MLWLLWFLKIEWGNYVFMLLRKMKQLTIYKLAFWTVMFFKWINFDLLYCYGISLENFTESTFPPLEGNSRHMPGESLHAAAPSQCLVIITIIIINIIIIILLITIIIRLEIRIFRHPFSKYPTVRWKWQVRASIGTAKRDIGVCANTDRVFFPPHDACVWQCIPPNGYLNGLSDEQPWTSWGALFSDPDISALLWMSSSMPPPKWALVTCLVRLFTQQPLRSVSSSASSSSSSSSSSFDLKFVFFDIHFPSTQRCDESDRFEHP